MYCRAAATLAITSASRITVMAYLQLKTNWAANLPSRGLDQVANPLQSREIGESHAAWVESSSIRHGDRPVASAGCCSHGCLCVARAPTHSAGARLEHPLRLSSMPAR